MKHVLIINPVSGKQDMSNRIIPEFKKAVGEQDFAVEITKAHGHAAQITQHYAENGEAVRFYICGGDGTLNEAICGCYSYENAEVACLPYGSGNDFIRNFGEKSEFQNIVEAVEGKSITIDLIRANGGVCAAIASVGVDADVAYGIPAFRRIPFCGGQMAYNLSIIKCLCKRLGRKMNIEIDGERLCGDYLIAAVCNGKTYGGGYNAAPYADLTDGELDVIIVKKISRFRIANILALYKKGTHLKNGEVIPKLRDVMTYVKAKSVNITPDDGNPVIINIDGECEPAKGLRLSILPFSAKFVLPKAVLERYSGKFACV